MMLEDYHSAILKTGNDRYSLLVTIMDLKYPNARLFIHGLMSTGSYSPTEALVKSAFEFGLISSDHVESMPQKSDNHLCPCMATAKNVLFQYFQRSKTFANTPDINAEVVWANLERDALTHRQIRHDCQQFAPTILDLMLQQLLRYH